jgi:sulfite reductase beta subunit-like hemoprotein
VNVAIPTRFTYDMGLNCILCSRGKTMTDNSTDNSTDNKTDSKPDPKPDNKVDAKAVRAESLKREKDGFDVLSDLLRYSESGDFASLKADEKSRADIETRFRWHGVYQQKPNNGHFMLRIKIPGGQLSPEQLRAIAAMADDRARGFCDITTRQDIQFHWLTLADLKPIFQGLWDIGMTSQFACGDTPRNVVSCPLAGVLEDEIIDSSSLCKEVSDMFIESKKEFSNLPRKFKPSIGGCSIHCHQPQINDYGMYGVKRSDGTLGYGLLVGGGLSTHPMFGQSMRVFVRPEQAPAVSRAICQVFRDHGRRDNRGRARLKFVVADKGWQWTRDRIEEILGYQLERDETLLNPPALHNDHTGVGKQKDGNRFVGVPVGRGRITARNCKQIADLADKYATGQKRIRLTVKQNLILLDVPPANVEPLVKALTDLGLPPKSHSLRTTLISCTGTEFCNLAVVETKHRAGRILQYLEEQVDIDFPLFISVTGCPNACAQYQIADIGLTGSQCNDPSGRTDPVTGKASKVDAFNVLLGARLGNDAKFGEVIARGLPADRIQLALKSVIQTYLAERADEDDTFSVWVERNDPKRLQKLLADAVATVAPTPAAPAVATVA